MTGEKLLRLVENQFCEGCLGTNDPKELQQLGYYLRKIREARERWTKAVRDDPGRIQVMRVETVLRAIQPEEEK